jgi:hypothetical protein
VKSWWQHQPVRALFAQCAGLAVAFALVSAFPAHLHGLWTFGIAQGFLAAIIARMIGQPRWWMPIHILFLPTVLLATGLHLPSELYLAAFIGLLLVFWGTAKGDVPLFLSSREVFGTVAEIVDDERARRFVDLGAGTGSVALPLAKHFPLLVVEAWEHAPVPYAVLAWRGRRLANLRVLRRSFWECDLTGCDVAFAFLSPAVMEQIGAKVRREMLPGKLFVSSSFEVPGWLPERVLKLDDRRQTTLYCYRIPEKS